MPLLGGACKLSEQGALGGHFVSDPYVVADFVLPPGPSFAEINLLGDGTIWADRGITVPNQIGRWDGGSGTQTISDYDFQLEKVSGDDLNRTGGEAQNVWINGFANMFWGVETSFGLENFVGILRKRPAGGGGDLDTANTTLSAESTP